MEEMDEEHGGEEGLLADAKNDKGKLTQASVKDRLSRDQAATRTRPTSASCWKPTAALIEQEAAAGKQVKDAQKALDAKVAAQYAAAEAETRSRRWWWTTNGWPRSRSSVQGELDRVSQALTGRIRQLAERYATPIPQLWPRWKPCRPGWTSTWKDGVRLVAVQAPPHSPPRNADRFQRSAAALMGWRY